MKKNFIVGFTPYHALISGEILNDLEGDVFCFFSKGYPESSKKYKKVDVFLGNNKIAKKASNLLSLVFVRILLIFWKLRGFEVDVFAPHPSNIIVNYLFFSYKNTRKINIYEDGILNYYDVDSSIGDISKENKILSKILFLKYKKYSGHLSGFDSVKVNSIYATRPYFLVGKNNFKKIKKIELKKIEGHGGLLKKVLFLDQDVSNIVGMADKKEIIRNLMLIFHDYEIYYKPHHDYGEFVNGMIPLTERQKSISAESLVPEMLPEIVISFCSSALINIKSICEEVKCYWLVSDMISITRDSIPCKLSEVFLDAGVCKLEEN